MGYFITLISNPDYFFKKQIEHKFSLKIPLMILGVLTLCLFIFVAACILLIMKEYYFPSADYINMTMFIAIPLMVLFLVVMRWLVSAVIIYVVSFFFHGTGPFSRVLEFSGDAMIIDLIVIVFMFITSLIFVLPGSGNFDAFSLVSSTEFILIMGMINLFGLLASANIYRVGIKYARNISGSNATIIAVAYCLFWILMNIVLS